MKLEEIRKNIQDQINSLKIDKKKVILKIWENQMSPIKVINGLYKEERDLEKKIIDLEVKEVEEIVSWIEERDYEVDSDGYLHMKYSQKLRYLKNVQSELI